MDTSCSLPSPLSAAVGLFGNLLPPRFLIILPLCLLSLTLLLLHLCFFSALPPILLHTFFSRTFLCASLPPAILPCSHPPLLHTGHCSLALEMHRQKRRHRPCSQGVRVPLRSHACDSAMSARSPRCEGRRAHRAPWSGDRREGSSWVAEGMFCWRIA